MDDDVVDIIFYKYIPNSFTDFIQRAFDICIIENAFIFGLYPVSNLFFVKHNTEYSTKLTYICGAVYGFINRKLPELNNVLVPLGSDGNKEDVEKSILYWKHDGKVIRFNTTQIKTKYYGTHGGLGTLTQRIEPMKKYSIILNNAYPNITKIKIRKNGLYEITLHDNINKTSLHSVLVFDD